MEHLFIPYELALLAKEKGFNEPCLASFLTTGKMTIGSTFGIKNSDLKEGVDFIKYGYIVTAPLYQQITDWFREKHNLVILIQLPFDVFFTYSIDGISPNGYYTDSSYKEKKDFVDYYEALNTAIEEAFKLI